MFVRLSYTLLISSIIFSCSNSSEENHKFHDPVVRKIYELKDRRQSDSLLNFFASDDAQYRYEAVIALASVQDSTIITQLSNLYAGEREAKVRKAIAFTLGQINTAESELALANAIATEKDQTVQRELLEAYGKVTTNWKLPITNFENDTLLTEGVAWSLYRAGLRGKTDTNVNRIAAQLLSPTYTTSTQIGAANFFARGAKEFQSFLAPILTAATDEKSPEVRMAAVAALGKIKSDSASSKIEAILQNDEDYRVRVNAARALQNFPFEKVKSSLYAALYDKNVNVGIASAESIRQKVSKENWIELSNLTGRVQDWRVKSILYQAALSVSDNKALENEILKLYKQSVNPFHKAALLQAMGSNTDFYDFVESVLKTADTAVIRNAAADALAQMNHLPGFSRTLKNRFATLAKEVMPAGDIAVVGIFAGTLGDKNLGYKNMISDYAFLHRVRNKLKLPRDYEAVQPLEEAIAYFEDKKTDPIANKFNHPIDWELVQDIRKDQVAIIKTSKGHIKIKLFVEEAPGSVSNFVQLARNKYFNDKAFHRVVPNFVIQGGCNRGDGWGSEDYSIRSEFSPRRYTTGSVGMASAGKDTEGTQWFITHSPTPHLDGRYTIFAEVVDGIDAVHYIEVGDKIIEVELQEE